ncbi:thioredoxin family protein [Variovorax sp. WDL1]|uniref:thioredoxin family protein n=2 Tax=Variovorax TaxID=34072 RepID=UPI001E4723F0|nr:thioredoxin family protein [Variovorax sp. WDL1]
MNDRRNFMTVAGAALVDWRGLMSNDESRLDGATTWLNSPPLSSASLRGKVVLIDFWTYSCINWRREFPYVRAWAAKYKDAGLVVIGVHSPEFAFERSLDNVRSAVKDIGVTYPVAVDSDHAIWRAFGNAYWPALYFIDSMGRIRHSQFGEGNYDKSERAIQRLLGEISPATFDTGLVTPVASGAEAPADWANLKSPETYAGYARSTNLASGGAVANRRRSYDAPARLRLNQWALAGDWTLREEAAVLEKEGGRIAYCFHARDLHLVMGPGTGGHGSFRITIDGRTPGADHGVDVDAQGRGTLDAPRMYQLVRVAQRIGDRRFEIEFEKPGAEVFSFTFG